MFELYVVFFVFYCKIIKWLNNLFVTSRPSIESDALKDKTTLMLEKPATLAAVCKTHGVK